MTRGFCSPPADATSVKLKSKQEEVFEVEKAVACRSVTVKNMVDDTGLDTPVPLPMVDSKILIKVIEYCKYHRTRFACCRLGPGSRRALVSPRASR